MADFQSQFPPTQQGDQRAQQQQAPIAQGGDRVAGAVAGLGAGLQRAGGVHDLAVLGPVVVAQGAILHGEAGGVAAQEELVCGGQAVVAGLCRRAGLAVLEVGRDGLGPGQGPPDGVRRGF